MADIWYPYTGPGDAAARIGRFADRQFGPGYGIIWSDGRIVVMLRKPQVQGGHGTILNVLRTHVAAPHPAERPTSESGFIARAKALFWHIMEIEGEAEIANSEA